MRKHNINGRQKTICPFVGKALYGEAALAARQRGETDPAQILGRRVRKDFGAEHGVHEGTVSEFTLRTGYRLTYTDGDIEDLYAEDVLPLLIAELADASMETSGATEGV